jgi:integrase
MESWPAVAGRCGELPKGAGREIGKPLEAVSRALGHTSLAAAADVYAHWTPAMQERQALRMDAVLGG